MQNLKILNTIEKTVFENLVEMAVKLSGPVENSIKEAINNEKPRSPESLVLKAITKNLEIASTEKIPMCQDTGMFWFLIRIGNNISIPLSSLENCIETACEKAAKTVPYRPSVVMDPFLRNNSRNNLPPIIQFESKPGTGIEILAMLKGFGSENGGGAWLLKPTSTSDEIIDIIVNRIKEVGGGACPPVTLGIGAGGTLDIATNLSKKALFRPIGMFSSKPHISEMERTILNNINNSNIGPGGVGGNTGCIHVAIETFPTHIAGLPLALSTGCWANRKRIMKF